MRTCRDSSHGGCYDEGEDARKGMAGLLDVVALLSEVPAQRLARDQVGTIVEELNHESFLVEFSDDQGRAYAVSTCPRTALLVLHSVPEAA
jgi:hypothetical protein